MTKQGTIDKKSAPVTRRDAACARCGAPFSCGADARDGSCWCAALPALATQPDPASGCLCPACLQAALAAAGQPLATVLSTPPPEVRRP